MRVLMLERPVSARCFGGEQVHLRAWVRELSQLGVEVVCSADADPATFDLVHVWNLQYPEEALDVVRRTADVPLVLTPIYCDRRRSQFALCIQQVLSCLPADKHALALARIGRRELDIPCGAGLVVRRHEQLPVDASLLADQRELLGRVAALCVLSPQEAEAMRSDLGGLPDIVAVTPVAPAPVVDPEPFRRAYGIEEDFVLVPAARIEPSKNQWTVLHALGELGLPLVVTGAVLEPSYESFCRAAAPAARFTGLLEPALFASALTAARVTVHASVIECASLCALDAASATGSLVVGLTGSEPHYFADLAHLVDPLDVDAIRGATATAWGEAGGDRSAALRVRARGWFDWSRSARAVLTCYESVLAAATAR